MINRKILFSTISIVGALTIGGAATFAAFASTATASSSTFSSGTDSLLVSPDNVDSDFASSITSPFHDTKITPGYTKTFNFFLKNDATNSTDDLNVQATFSGGSADAVLDGALMTQFSCTDNNVTTTPSPFSVTAMRGGSVSLGTVSSGTVATCTLTVSLPATADNTVTNKTTTFDVLFNATGAQSSPTPSPTPPVTPSPSPSGQ